jgi:hypothetical protein
MMRRFITPSLITLILCAVYLAAFLMIRQSDVSEIMLRSGVDRTAYDGQFTYYIATDPITAKDKILELGDVPAYRYQRILHPFLSMMVGLGHHDLTAWASVLINVIMLVAGVWALERLLEKERLSVWYALTYGLYGGVFFAVRANTTEPLAYGLVLLAILAGERKQLTLSAILLALAALAKETTLFFAAGYIAYYATNRRLRDAIRVALIVAIPFALWQITLRVWLGSWGIGSGGAMATPFEIVPFGGLLRILEAGADRFVVFLALLLPTVVIPALWGLWRGIRDLGSNRADLYSWLLLANAAIIPFVPFSTYREPFGMLRFAVGLVIAVILYSARRKARRSLNYSTLWILFGMILLPI